MGYVSGPISNCELVNLEGMLQNGTVITDTLIEKVFRLVNTAYSGLYGTVPLTEARERKRLEKLFEGMPENKRKLAEGLIIQAARLRVRMNELHADIEENGMTELFQQSDKVEPYSRERPEAGLWIKLDKSYQAIIRQLTELVPPDERKTDDLDAFLSSPEKVAAGDPDAIADLF